jgi:hypothetical protein
MAGPCECPHNLFFQKRFKDELSGKVISNAFTVGIVSPDEVEKTWHRIQSAADLPIAAVLEMVGLVGYEMTTS